MTETEQLTLFVCGKKPTDHECDSDGPFLCGGDEVPTLPESEARGKPGYTWGSATCSKCGQMSMADLW